MNDVINSKSTCEFMAASIVRVLLICTTSVIIKLIAAQDFIFETASVEIGLQFDSEPEDIIAIHGKRAELSCSVSTPLKGRLSIHWTRNNVKISNTKRKYVREDSSTIPHRSFLIFEKVIGKKKNNQTDAGTYCCVATVNVGASSAVLISKPAVVKIAEISASSMQSEFLTAVINETVRLSCKINSIPAAEITWTFQNKFLHPENKRYDLTIPDVLYISDVQPSDNGEYRCIGNNTILNKIYKSGPFVLEVKFDTDYTSSNEKFLSPLLPKNMTVLKNEQLNLECAATGHLEVNILWMYRISENATNIIIDQSKKHHNTLQKAVDDLSDSGIYTCVVYYRNLNKNYTQSVHVIIVMPPIITESPKSKKLALAAKVRFPCEAYGYPQPIINWLHNGNHLQSNARVKITAPKKVHLDDTIIVSKELVLTSTISSDVGIYQCIASNEYGVSWTATYLYMDDLANPMAPINPRCHVVNSTSIWVFWEQPKDDNEHLQLPVVYVDDEDEVSSQIKVARAFTVACYPTDGGEEIHFPTVNTSLLINNLIPSTNYTFYIRTYGGRSGSNPSETVTCFTSEENFDMSLSAVANILPSISPTPMNESTLHLRLINETTIEVNWKMDKPAIESETFVVKYKKRDDISSKTKFVNFDEKRTVLFGLEPETEYEISLKIIVNETEGEIITDSILTTKPEKIKPLISVQLVTSNTIKLVWAHFSNVSHTYYKIKYKKMGTDTWLDAPPEFPESNTIVISDLQPDTVYYIKVKSYNDDYVEDSIPSLQVRTSVNVSLAVQNVSYKQLNASTVRVFWEGLSRYPNEEKSYVVSYLPVSNSQQRRNVISVGGNTNYVDISNLKPFIKYTLTVRVKNNVSVLGPESKPLSFSLNIDFEDKNRESDLKLEINDVSLTSEQILGIFIGCGIASIFIILCVLIIIYCKRQIEKYNHQMVNHPGIFAQDEKHEMKILPKSSSNYKIHYVNGRSNLNVQLPLLTSSSNFSNGSIQNKDEDSLCKFYNLEAKDVRQENDRLLNFDSPMDESCLTIHETNEPDHEGGDSGYCDRHHSQSPQIKEYGSIHRLRKCSDITVDDGYYENELRGTSGTSPSESNRFT